MWGSSNTSRDSNSSNPPLQIKVRDLDAERDHPNTAAAPLSVGWLLRLFRSEFFDAFMAVTYLYRYRNSGGVHDYLCNQLYALADADLETFMPQVCNLLVHHARDSPALERFVLDKCGDSMHIALQVFWFLQAAVEDAARRPDRRAEARCRLLRTRCETAAVNGSHSVMLAAAAERISPATLVSNEVPFSPRKNLYQTKALFPSNSTRDISTTSRPPIPHVPSTAKPRAPRPPKSTPSKSISTEQSTYDHVPMEKPPELLEPHNTSGIAAEHSMLIPGAEQRTSVDDTCEPLSQEHSAETPDHIVEASPTKEPGTTDEPLVIKPIEVPPKAITVSGASTTTLETTPTSENSCVRGDTAAASADGALIDDDAATGNDVPESNNATGETAHSVSQSVRDTSQPAADCNSITATKADVCAAPESEHGESVSAPDASLSSENGSIQRSDSPNQPPPMSKLQSRSTPDLEADFDPLALLAMKQERYDYFNDSQAIASAFVRLSLTTRDLPHEQRQVHLARGLEEINSILLRRMKGEPGEPVVDGASAPLASEVAALGASATLRSVHLPLARASSQVLRILRVHSDEVVILTSRTRAPYMVNIEVLPTEMQCSDKLLFCEHRVVKKSGASSDKRHRPHHRSRNAPERFSFAEPPERDEEHEFSFKGRRSSSADSRSSERSSRRLSDMTPPERMRASVRKAVYGDSYSLQPLIFCEAEEKADANPPSADSAEFQARQAVTLGVYGELWSWKEGRILSKSPFKDVKGTRLMPFIVKAGDDLRQEQLAIQLIGQFQSIFEEEGVDVFLKPFTVMSVSSEAGFVEVLTDAVSVHSLKKKTPNFVSLLNYFERAYGPIGSDSFRAAQRRFIRSMAGYSLVTYLLQIKDRHNGNIMIDAQGRIIHIDFGFMLTNSPGAIKFENVPFKLTEEYLQVICATNNVQDLSESSKTEGYRYFLELFVLGLLAAKKHHEKITTLVEIMTEGTTMPCMQSGHSVVESLRSRFAVGMPEDQCISFALGLIDESRLSWRSASYDRFQAYSNGYR